MNSHPIRWLHDKSPFQMLFGEDFYHYYRAGCDSSLLTRYFLDAMTAAELHNRIYCWLWLYSNVKGRGSRLNSVILFKDGVHFRWLNEMLDDVADLTIPKGMEQSRAAEDLRLAMCYARSGDIGFMPHIENLLMKVETNISRYVRAEEMQSIN